MPHRALTLVLLLAATACAGHRKQAGSRPPSPAGMFTLCVANRSESVGTIRVWVEQVRTLTVGSGRRECKPIHRVALPMNIHAESMGGGMGGPIHYDTQITNLNVACWEWTLRNSSTSEIRLMPCEL
jgi:hypothetical protein